MASSNLLSHFRSLSFSPFSSPLLSLTIPYSFPPWPPYTLWERRRYLHPDSPPETEPDRDAAASTGSWPSVMLWFEHHEWLVIDLKCIDKDNVDTYERCSKLSIKNEWKLFILARNPCAILARPQWELARGQFFKLSLRDLARRWIPEIWCIFACAMQARSWFRTWVSWLLRFSARSVVSQLLDFLACLVASRLLGSNQRSSYFASSVVPECLQWMYGLEPGYNQYSGMAPSPCSGFA